MNNDMKKKDSTLKQIIVGIVIAVIAGVIVYIITTGTPVIFKNDNTTVTSTEDTQKSGFSASATESPSDSGINNTGSSENVDAKGPKTETESPAILDEEQGIIIPDVINLTFEEAQDILIEKGIPFSYTSYNGETDNKTQLFVFDQSIPADSIVTKGTQIELVILGAKKGEEVKVPSVVGLEQNEAALVLRNSGLRFTVSRTVEDGVNDTKKYYVKSQEIPEDTIVASGTIIPLQLTLIAP